MTSFDKLVDDARQALLTGDNAGATDARSVLQDGLGLYCGVIEPNAWGAAEIRHAWWDALADDHHLTLPRRVGSPVRHGLRCPRIGVGASGTMSHVSFTMPEFPEPTAIDEARSWTATYDSYDQRHDVSYYKVTIHEGGHDVGQIMVEVFMFPAGDDWGTAEFVPYMREEIHQIAVAGTSNTEYQG